MQSEQSFDYMYYFLLAQTQAASNSKATGKDNQSFVESKYVCSRVSVCGNLTNSNFENDRCVVTWIN